VQPNLEQIVQLSLSAGKLPCNRRKARENACKSSKTGFGFAPDWLKDWQELYCDWLDYVLLERTE